MTTGVQTYEVLWGTVISTPRSFVVLTGWEDQHSAPPALPAPRIAARASVIGRWGFGGRLTPHRP